MIKYSKSLSIIIIFISFIGGLFLIFHDSIYLIDGGSMEPTLVKGDLVFTIRKNPEDIEAGFYNGDIVVIDGPSSYYEQGFDSLFWPGVPNSAYICHRVVDKKEIDGTWYFLTRGDNSIWLFDGLFRTLNKSNDYMLFEYNSSELIYIKENHILGVMSFKIPFIGWLKDLSSYIIVFSVLIYFIILMLKKRNIKISFFKRRRNSKFIKNKIYFIVFLIMLIMEIFAIVLCHTYFVMDRSNMAPTINYGDIIIAEKKSPDEISINNLVLVKGPQFYYEQGFDPLFWNYLPNNSQFISRVIDKKVINNTFYFLTCQDNGFYPLNGMFRTILIEEGYALYEYNTSNLIYISADAIKGVISFQIPFFGNYKEFFHLGLIIFCSILSLDIIVKKLNINIVIHREIS